LAIISPGGSLLLNQQVTRNTLNWRGLPQIPAQSPKKDPSASAAVIGQRLRPLGDNGGGSILRQSVHEVRPHTGERFEADWGAGPATARVWTALPPEAGCPDSFPGLAVCTTELRSHT
jgi:hypothetical protein